MYRLDRWRQDILDIGRRQRVLATWNYQKRSGRDNVYVSPHSFPLYPNALWIEKQPTLISNSDGRLSYESQVPVCLCVIRRRLNLFANARGGYRPWSTVSDIITRFWCDIEHEELLVFSQGRRLSRSCYSSWAPWSNDKPNYHHNRTSTSRNYDWTPVFLWLV